MLEIDVAGVFIPAMLLWSMCAFTATSLIDRALGRSRIYRRIWHRGLFDFAVFIILWGALAGLTYQHAFGARTGG